MKNKTIKIDQEFRDLIPPLSPEELFELENSIGNEGCRDSLVTWGDILLDGYHRLEICERLNLPYKTTAVELPDRAAAADWIDRNQLGRRNLAPDQMSLLRGRRYNRAKKSVGKPAGTILGQNEPISTADRLAKEHGVSPATIKRDAKFAEEVERSPELQRAIRDHKPVSKAKKEANIQVRHERHIAETKATLSERRK